MGDVGRDLPKLRIEEQLAKGVARHSKGLAKGGEGKAGKLVTFGCHGGEQGFLEGGLGLGGLPPRGCMLHGCLDCVIMAPLLLLPLAKVPQLLGVGMLEGELLSSMLTAKIRLHILLPLYLALLLVFRGAVGPGRPKELPLHLPKLVMAGP